MMWLLKRREVRSNGRRGTAVRDGIIFIWVILECRPMRRIRCRLIMYWDGVSGLGCSS